MVDYIVELKDSVFRETPLAEGDFDDERRLAFDSKADAEEWVTEQNREHTSRGQLTLHTAHPADTSDVDAYVVFQGERRLDSRFVGPQSPNRPLQYYYGPRP